MADTNLSKNRTGYGYKYCDIAQINQYLEDNKMSYYQYIDRIEGEDYIMTVRIIDGEEKAPLRGCRVVQANLKGISNPAQEQGSALTYARRYSLLMAFGLATEDDDAQSLTQKKTQSVNTKSATTTKTDGESVISDNQYKALVNAINNNKITNDMIKPVLQQYGYNELKDIKLKDYNKICNHFKSLITK